jgi:acetyltransferase-like isoleucine patch superfamily enzyme
MLKKIFDKLIKWLYNGFKCEDYSRKTIIIMILFQKVFRINSETPWPVHWSSRVDAPDKIQRGTEAPGYMHGCYIDGRNGIILGNNVIIGSNVNIISQNHDLTDFNSYIAEKPIIIGANSWLGSGCTILAGVELGEHTVVGAGAVVTKSFPDSNQIIAGNPARVIRKIENYKITT